MRGYDVDAAPAALPRTQPARWLWSRRARAPAVAAVVVGCALYGVGRYRASPEHQIRQFVASSRRGDAAGMFSLVSPVEARRLGLTPAKLEAMLADAAGEPGGVAFGDIRWEPLNDRQRLYNRWARVSVYRRGGAPLHGPGGGPLTTIVQAYNTDDGWKIGASILVAGVLAERAGAAARRGSYAALCRRNGVRPELYDPAGGTWEQASPGR